MGVMCRGRGRRSACNNIGLSMVQLRHGIVELLPATVMPGLGPIYRQCFHIAMPMAWSCSDKFFLIFALRRLKIIYFC